MPIGIRQDAVLCFFSVPKFIQLATNIPNVMNNWYVLLKKSVMLAGTRDSQDLGTTSVQILSSLNRLQDAPLCHAKIYSPDESTPNMTW